MLHNRRLIVILVALVAGSPLFMQHVATLQVYGTNSIVEQADRLYRQQHPEEYGNSQEDGDSQSFSEENSQSSSGGIDWYGACEIAHTFLGLKTPCDQLVTFDNQLTEMGEQVLSCYGGGLLLPLVDPATASQLYALGKKVCPE